LKFLPPCFRLCKSLEMWVLGGGGNVAPSPLLQRCMYVGPSYSRTTQWPQAFYTYNFVNQKLFRSAGFCDNILFLCLSLSSSRHHRVGGSSNLLCFRLESFFFNYVIFFFNSVLPLASCFYCCPRIFFLKASFKRALLFKTKKRKTIALKTLGWGTWTKYFILFYFILFLK
jgi:hypothetical protein